MSAWVPSHPIGPLDFYTLLFYNLRLCFLHIKSKSVENVDAVVNFPDKGPVIVGYGTPDQEGALLTAGAERVILHPSQADHLTDPPGLSVRPDDTLLVVQPALIRTATLRRLTAICGADRLAFQVVGHEPMFCHTDTDLNAWRRQVAKIPGAPMKAVTGRPAKVEYTVAQAEAIIREWHAIPRRKPAEVRATAERILGLDPGALKPHWVRDVVIKFVGTAQRDKPEGWTGISTDSE